MSEDKQKQKMQFDYSFDFQKKILALLVRDFKFLTEYGYNIINPKYFDSFYHQFICKNIIKYFTEHGEAPDQVNLESLVVDSAKKTRTDDEALNNMLDEIYEIFNMELNSMGFVKDKVLKFVKRQNLIRGLDQLGGLLDSDDDYDKAVSIIEKAVHVGHSNDLGMNFAKSYKELPKLYREEYGIGNLVKSGLPTLDRFMGGGFYNDFLYVISGPPGRGKTSLMSAMAANCMIRGNGVFYYTFEVPAVEIMFKVICAITKLSHDEVISGDDSLFEDKIKIFDKYSKQLQIKKYGGRTISTHGIRSHLSRTRTVEGIKPSIIFVDYADYILPTSGESDSSYYDRGNTYQDLLNLAEEYNCPVVTASQPKVAAWEKDTIEEADLAESSKKAQLARGIITINQTAAEEEENYMRLYTAKMSKGVKSRSVKISVDLGRCQFRELKQVN